MGKDKKTPVVINDVEYNLEDLKPEQQLIIKHLADLNRKISSSEFNLDQLKVGRDAFMRLLEETLGTPEEVEVLEE